jgi:hypothetical protein
MEMEGDCSKNGDNRYIKIKEKQLCDAKRIIFPHIVGSQLYNECPYMHLLIYCLAGLNM